MRRDELVRSLATSEARTAKLRAYRLYLASERLFSALRATPMLTDAQLARLLQDFYGLILDDEGRGRLTHGAIPNNVRAVPPDPRTAPELRRRCLPITRRCGVETATQMYRRKADCNAEHRLPNICQSWRVQLTPSG